MAVALREDHQHQAAEQAKGGPEGGDVFGGRVGVRLVDDGGNSVEQHQDDQERERNPHHGAEKVAQEFNEAEKVHGRTAWAKCMKTSGKRPMARESAAVRQSGISMVSGASPC